MTKQENRQRIKNEALNKIRNLYNPKTEPRYSYYGGDANPMEEIGYDVKYIIEHMETQLRKLKEK
jgi:hypothetical protein